MPRYIRFYLMQRGKPFVLTWLDISAKVFYHSTSIVELQLAGNSPLLRDNRLKDSVRLNFAQL